MEVLISVGVLIVGILMVVFGYAMENRTIEFVGASLLIISALIAVITYLQYLKI
ncbi:hypothetical protein V7O66_04570 [Methanolobus sp. ZRKC3]|uniref:hypothetical protein n=1 Tax=Methanolobus sp. ZRKC3 TaxID=3125786 RepID=UPI003248823F